MHSRLGNSHNRPSFVARASFSLAFSLFVAAGLALHAEASEFPADLVATPLDQIPPGTVVWDVKKNGFTNVNLFVKGKLTAGDVDEVTDSMNYYGELFNIVYMTNVKTVQGKRPVLDRIAVGFSTKIKGKDVVISSETANQLGAKLSLIGRNVLSGNEAALEKITLTAMSPTFAVVDAPTVVLYQNKHQTMLARFVIWVSPEGKVETAVWLLQKGRNKMAFAEKVFQFLPPEMIETRVMHVDGSQITFGLPSASAFAMVEIPQGKAFAVTDRLRQAGTAVRFTAESLNELAASLSEALDKK